MTGSTALVVRVRAWQLRLLDEMEVYRRLEEFGPQRQAGLRNA
jgi:hypothetical protein